MKQINKKKKEKKIEINNEFINKEKININIHIKRENVSFELI